MLITNQIFDAEGMELDIRSIVLREDNGNKVGTSCDFVAAGFWTWILDFVPLFSPYRQISFTISPPRVGMFKFMLFGSVSPPIRTIYLHAHLISRSMPKPKQKGKWRLPLLATFLVDCKLAKLPPPEDDPPPLPANAYPDYDRRRR